MRLQKTLQEAAEFQMAVKDIQPKMTELYRVLKKNNFQMSDESLEKSLDSMFKDKNIGFTKGPKRGGHFSHVFDGAGITQNLFVQVEYVPGFAKYFRRYAKEGKSENFFDIRKNEFFRSLAELVTHEYRHLFQSLSSGGKTMENPTTSAEPGGFTSYLKNPHELDAFALQAAVQNIRTGESSVIATYHQYFKDEDPKIWQKFLKKTSAHVKDLKKRGMYKYIKLK